MENRVAIISKQLLSELTYQEICLQASENWGISSRQVTRYIRRCYDLWHKIFVMKRKRNLDYHLAKRADLYKQAYSKKQWNICLEIIRDEAKLAGIYPSEKHDVKVEGELIITDAKRKLVNKIAGIVKRTGEDEIPE
ncbi:MAG: hypothetical protein KKC03_13020 [Bacteroidetes bacterium]|nr:hypothetical protein [Bacteroidota bacterium]